MFRYCIFIPQITKLKIDSNPFAKGFRDSTRLSEFESFYPSRESMESLMSQHTYARSPLRAYTEAEIEESLKQHREMMARGKYIGYIKKEQTQYIFHLLLFHGVSLILLNHRIQHKHFEKFRLQCTVM